MGFKELMKAKSIKEYTEARNDSGKMEELKQRSAGEVLKNAGKSMLDSAEVSMRTSKAFGFTLTPSTIRQGRGEKKSLKDVVARVESGSELQSRVTATRLLAIGIFAFAAKKKKGGEKYITIEGPDFVWTEEVKRDSKDVKEAMKFVAKINSNAKSFTRNEDTEVPTTSSVNTTDELIKLKGLLDAGALTQKEFDQQKAKLLN